MLCVNSSRAVNTSHVRNLKHWKQIWHWYAWNSRIPVYDESCSWRVHSQVCGCVCVYWVMQLVKPVSHYLSLHLVGLLAVLPAGMASMAPLWKCDNTIHVSRYNRGSMSCVNPVWTLGTDLSHYQEYVLDMCNPCNMSLGLIEVIVCFRVKGRLAALENSCMLL